MVEAYSREKTSHGWWPATEPPGPASSDHGLTWTDLDIPELVGTGRVTNTTVGIGLRHDKQAGSNG